MLKPSLRKRLMVGLVLIAGLGMTLIARAAFPDTFHRIVQIGERLGIIYGGQDQNTTTEFITVKNDGRVVVDDGTVVHTADLNFPGQEALLNLLSSDKALLVPRVESVNDVSTAEDGMVVYERFSECFRLYQEDAWTPCLDVADQFVVAPTEPVDGEAGDVYYNTTTNQLFVHDGQTFVEVTVNFELLTSYNVNCQRFDLIDQSLQLRCPNDTKLASLFFEQRTFSDMDDNHIIPEITGVECCEVATGLYWWDTTDWSACDEATGSQTRTVTCRDENGTAVDAALCVSQHRPMTTQMCRGPQECQDTGLIENGDFESGHTGFTTDYRRN